MANQNESSLPLSSSEGRKTADLLPRFYRTDSNKKFLSATLDQLTQPGTVKKLTGYIGRKNAKAVKSSDVFIAATDNDRQNYQLEPAAVIQDYLGNTSFYKDYIDHINHVETNGGNVANHERLNKQEFYAWNPHINWDKFVNFQQYYWLPYGPTPIEVQGQQQSISSTYTVTIEDEGDNYVYIFTPDGLTRNPALTLYRGQTYNFSIDALNNPFSIKTVRVAGPLERYTDGVSASAVQSGTITFTVPNDSPDVLFYVSEVDANTGGVFSIKDIDENTFLDLTTDIIGKKTYTMSNNIPLSNGMKLFFTGNVTPSIYSSGYWYVEGVGTAINLVSDSDLEIISSYSQETALLFDDEPFDQSPFSTLTSFPRDKDYIVINRASPDRNQWSRYNRWYHQDVIIAAAAANGQVTDIDQAQRATRPIIEFEAGLKLFNFGHQSKKNVDVVDTFTTDVFSTIEGSMGYNIDGIDLANGMRVLFTADPDRFVNGKIFKVNFIDITEPGRRIDFLGNTGVDIVDNIITSTTAHGLTTGNQIIYLNNANSNIEGLINRQVYYVMVVDATHIRLYTDKILLTQANILNAGDGIHTVETFNGYRHQINLTEDIDTTPLENETVLVKTGLQYQGSMFWYNGTIWKLGQNKTTINQPPLFDIFDEKGVSYGDVSVYDGSNFHGTKVFSYKVGTGNNDTSLGFPLSYQNISNIGDIVFEFNLLTDSFNYKEVISVLNKTTDIGYLKVITDLITTDYQNGWTLSKIANVQPIVRTFKESELINNFPIDVYDFKDNLDDLAVNVYVNGLRQNKNSYTVVDGPIRKLLVLNKNVATTDVVTLKCFAAQTKNEIGYYELPLSLQNNPLNENVTQFTLGQVIDHVDTIVDHITTFSGTYPGYSNLRNIGNITPYGTRFVQHSGPMNLSLYHLGSQTANIIKALEKSRNDYGKFKRAFITFASESGIDTETKQHVDFILQELAKDKTKTQSYYLSDMFAYAGATRSEYTVLDPRVTTYPLTSAFNLSSLSNRAANIYVNGEQLVHGKDYVFGTDVFFEILTTLTEGDIIEAYEYTSTDGSYCPATPSKLGLYPLFEPKIYTDDTYLEPTEVIQGHDGSITIAFGDYRDALILELEKRIFNNVKVKYNTQIFDIYDIIPGYSRTTAYSKVEVDNVMSQYFFQWITNIAQDYTQQNNALWDRLDSFTWNYRNNSLPNDSNSPAFWRGIYRWTLDTDRPHTHPWECLGFSIEPKWWQEVYGPLPYTSNNYVLWDDIKNGIVREPGVPIRTLSKFARTVLENGYPVDEDGNLVSPYDAGHVSGYINPTAEGYYVFGDVGPVESAWRRSSYYAFSVIQTALMLQPNHVLGTCLDRSRIVRNLNNQLVYADTNLRIQLGDLVLPSTASSTVRTNTAGLINYIVDYITSDVTLLVSQYANDLLALTNKISSKLGGFTSKSKFRLLLDSKSLSSSGGVFVPEENYEIIFNVSSPIKKIVYSGIVITKYPDGYEIRGYNNDHPYFTYYPYTLSGRTINVGGISESYIEWTEGKYYVAGKLVRANNQYYRVKTTHQSGEKFDVSYYTRLAELPVTGGRSAELRKAWDTSKEQTVSYGTKFSSIQSMVDFIQGYGVYLEAEGFVFDEFNVDLKNVNNWETSIKEFLFWSTQNWAEGSVISLSPAANTLVLTSNNSVVNNVVDTFFEYKIFRVDGQKLPADNINSFREGNQFVLKPENTNHGIYGATLYLVQKEHVLLLDNTTLFNDVIYDQAPGYRQERIKISGYLSTNWNGGFNIPGFIYDQAIITNWTVWTDYNLGDTVKYKEFYYSARTFLPGVELFDSESWIKLNEKPESQMLPNWNYKADQFSDFYSLDSDNFDIGQQKMAQHLIGYQKRQYLENIIQDDVSQYKFYQGMIIEKGTQNVFNKLFDVLSADSQDSLTFNEEWAVRVGNYGASDSFKEVEFKLDESKFKLNPQPFELTSTIDPTVVDFVYRQTPADVYIKPVGYTNNIWPLADTNDYLRTPGYVRYEDVKLHVDALTDLITADISTFVEGDYVWCAFEGRDWNIYRFTHVEFDIEAVEYSNGALIITCDKIPTITAGNVIGIENADKIKGFHKVTSVQGRKIYITTTVVGWQTPFVDLAEVLAYQFASVRASNIDNLNEIIPTNLKINEQVWVDDNSLGLYSVYNNNPVFREETINNFAPVVNLNFGKAVAISPNGYLTAVATNNDSIIVYTKSPSTSLWVAHDEYLPNLNLADPVNLNFGKEIAFSTDGEWLAISATTASEVNSSIFVEQGYVALYRKVSESNYNFEQLVISQTPASYEKFGSKLAFAKNGSQYILAVSAPGLLQTGKVYFYEFTSNAWTNYATPKTAGTKNLFGYDIAFSESADIFVASAPVDLVNVESSYEGKVYVYRLDNNLYTLETTLDSSVVDLTARAKFGQSVSLSTNGKYLAVGAPFTDADSVDAGKVFVFNVVDNFNLHQTIVSSKKEINAKFGYTVNFMNNDESLVIFSASSDIEKLTTFIEGGLTTFDNNTLRVVDYQVDSGRVDIFDRYATKFIFGESLTSDSTSIDLYGTSIAIATDYILISAPEDSLIYDRQGSVYAYTRTSTTRAWTAAYTETSRPDVYKIKKAFIYNRTKNVLTSYIDVVDASQGKIPGPADQEISYKTYFDPATYSVGTSAVNVDDGMNWTKDQVGMLWWDLTRARFLDNRAGGAIYRSTTWNTLYSTASIDIYEWVETKYLPSEWDKLSPTDKGNSLGISGTSRYGDAVYSVKKKYDAVAKTFQNTYYYWVKNPTVAPNVIGRSLSAYNVSRLISDPISEGYSCLALTGADSFSLVNVTNLIDSTDFNLTVQYWTVSLDYIGTNAHSQWKIISEHPNTVLPVELENKWIHSLTGKDENDRLVPDIKLPFKQQYGINFRPRQSMFINRVEALKQYIERVNSVLAKNLIVDDYDLTDLEGYNSPPSTVTGQWDITIDTNFELRFVGVATLEQAVLTPIIENGRIVGADVVSPGRGYVHAPYVIISKTGKTAVVKTKINAIGQVTGVEIINKGEGYQTNTTFTVRPFAVLVLSDSNTFDKWSTYIWNSTDLTWDREKGQAFDVTKYWNYIDWYATGYNQFTKIDHLVDNTYQLALLESNVGSIVQVKNIGSGGWLLLEKYNNIATIDYTQNYSVVGRENGTIQFSSNLYNYAAIGYDSVLFDSAQYDDLATIELKIIINTIKNKIFIDEFKVEYLKLFFASLRYALHEQTFIDWAFKTSFVKATHNVGNLSQKVTYNNDNLENFEDYIKEVKPYKTQIREYVSSYTGIEYSQSSVTDFDLIPTINSKFEVAPVTVTISSTGKIETASTEILLYPWKHWYDHVGFTVQRIELVDGGSGYNSNPVVRIEGGYGSGATAKAYIANGRVNRLVLITSGTGYLKAPTITIDGGLSVTGVAARATVVIESEVVRSNKISIKFDRISRTYVVTELEETETFTGTGSQLQFVLKFSPNGDRSTSYVTVNNIDVLRNDYSLQTKTATSRGYTSYYGVLTLETAPAQGETISVTYTKNFNHLSATDRINFYYNPTNGMYGKDLAQLMTGIDFGGTQITGLGFNVSGGWDSLPWFTDSWDAFDSVVDDRIFAAGEDQYEYDLDYSPTDGEEINVYVNGNRIDDTDFITYPMPGKPFVVMTPIIGDGVTQVFTLPNLNLTINANDKVIFRKSTSDGSYTPLENEYDTQLSGGEFVGTALTSATGIEPDDIILEGSGLVTPLTSAAPEEIVPGHISDAVAIKVYQLPTAGSAKIMFKNFICDGVTNEFSMGQIPSNPASIFVKVGSTILRQGADYTVNWQNQTVKLLTAPPPVTSNCFMGTLAGLGGNNGDYGRATVVDSAGNMYICGYTTGVDTNPRLLLTKHDVSGQIVWQQAFGDTLGNSTLGNAIALDSLDNVYVCASNGISVVAKFDPSGTILWQRQIGLGVVPYSYGVAVDISGNVFVSGGYYNGTSYDLLIIKFNMSGIVQWQRTLGTTAGNDKSALTTDSNGNVFVTGAPLTLAKFNSSGTLQWQRKITGLTVNSSDSLAVDSDNNIYVAGYCTEPFGVVSHGILLKYDTNGVLLWKQAAASYPNDTNSYGVDIDADNNAYVVGYSTKDDLVFGQQVFTIAKFNSAGINQWSRRVRSQTGWAFGRGIAVDNTGYFYVTGYYQPGGSGGAGGRSVLFAKLPVDGAATGTYTLGSGVFYYESAGSWSSWAYTADVAATFTTGTVSVDIADGSLVLITLPVTLSIATFEYTITIPSTLPPPPADKEILSVITFSVASGSLLDSNYFVSDGVTLEYITNAPWIEGIGSVVLVNGLAVDYELFQTTDSYASLDKVGIRFAAAHLVDSLITYMITADENQTASIIKIETLIVDGETTTFTLTNPVGTTNPCTNNVIVKSGGYVFSPTVNEYFTLENDILDYQLTRYKFPLYNPVPTDFTIHVDGVQLIYGADYIINYNGITVNLRVGAYVEGATLTVSHSTWAKYTITGNQITFATPPIYNIEVISFYNHTVEYIRRETELTSFTSSTVPGTYDYFNYQHLVGGEFKLSRTIAFDDYIWVIKNGVILTHSIDYYLDSDLVTIKMAAPLIVTDYLDVVCFSDQHVKSSYGYMQFKDMLNRTHYKRISKAKSTRLASNLLQKDAEILLVDGSKLSPPNPVLNLPGIIEINGERIEYFTKVGNTLGQLRRATLGTGAPTVHLEHTLVLDIGPTETIPYADTHIIETSVSNGVTSDVTLRYTPTSVNEIDVFVGGYRLKKVDYTLFEESNGYPYSPEGDSNFTAEFSVDGITSGISLTDQATADTRIVVIKKTGTQWGETDLHNSNSEIANFIKNSEAIFPEYLTDKYQYTLSNNQND
jgi:hypothetical protein